MKIIQMGKDPEEAVVRESCSKCKTIFEYTQTDIQPDSREGDYVVCPVCESFITARNPISTGI